MVDADGDSHPDLWALGNRGLLLTIRSLDGGQFAAPELGGVVADLGARFDIVAIDLTRDGIPDLITSSRVPGLPTTPPRPPGLPPIVIPGAGGGRILVRPPQTPLIGRPMPGISIGLPPSFVRPPSGPQDVGLIKGTPLVTSYFDDRGVERPAIFMVGVNGHLLERYQYVRIERRFQPPTTTSDPFPIVRGDPIGSSGTLCLPTFCDRRDPTGRLVQPTSDLIETRTELWTWVDHGTPPGTIVESQPVVFATNIGWNQVREVFVRGLDGHLWQMEIKDGSRQWIDRGLPPPPLKSPPGTPAVPLVGSPSVTVAVSGSIGTPAQALADVYALDAAGNVDRFQWSSLGVGTGGTPPARWLSSLGQIGSNNCVGAIGKVGDGSPAAMSWFGEDRRSHTQVVIVSAEGDLFSWRDGVWEEALTTNSEVVAVDPRRPPNDCPNRQQFGPLPTRLRVWKKAHTVRGTPSTLVWYAGGRVNRTIATATPWVESLAEKGVGSGDIREYHYGPDCRGEGFVSCVIKAVVRPSEQVVAATQALPPATPVTLPPGPVGTSLITPFPAVPELRARDLFVAAPGLVQDTNGDVVMLANTRRGNLTLVRPCPQTGACGFAGIGSLVGGRVWTRHVKPRSTEGSRTELAFTPQALMRAGQMTVFATQAGGVLMSFLEQPGNRDLDELNRVEHPPANRPEVTDNARDGQVAGCLSRLVGEQIFPQWAAKQRDFSGRPDLLSQLYPESEFKDGGFESENMRQIEGIIVGSHMSAEDNPTNHTIGAPGEIPQIHHDWNLFIRPDVKHQAMLSDANITNGGVMEIEWELDDQMFPLDVVPHIGDRVVVQGRHIFDCGHPPFRQEIHPPDAMAVIHGSSATLHLSRHGGPVWFQPDDRNLTDPAPLPSGDACPVAENMTRIVGGVVGDITSFSSLGIRTALFAANTCIRRSPIPLSAIGPGIETSCHFPYEHAMLDILGDHMPIEFDVPLPSPVGSDPQLLGAAGFETSFVATPEPHFRVRATPQMMAVATLGGAAPTFRFSAVWAAGNPPQRRFQVCFERQPLISHDDISESGEIIAGATAGAILGGILGGPGGAVIGGIGGAIFTDSVCEGDDDDEVVLHASVNSQTIRLSESGQTCLPSGEALRPEQTLSIRVAGFECDFSCSEHWDDNFLDAPNDRVGSVQMAFTQAQNFGVPGVGVRATYQLLSQPDLKTPKSRHFSAGDYRTVVTITESLVGSPP